MVLGCLLLNSPGFDGDDEDFIGHDKAGDAHGDIKSKHGVEIVPDHDVHDIRSLTVQSARAREKKERKKKLTLSIKMSPPEIRQKAPTSSEGGRAGKCDVGGLTYVIM